MERDTPATERDPNLVQSWQDREKIGADIHTYIRRLWQLPVQRDGYTMVHKEEREHHIETPAVGLSGAPIHDARVAAQEVAVRFEGLVVHLEWLTTFKQGSDGNRAPAVDFTWKHGMVIDFASLIAGQGNPTAQMEAHSGSSLAPMFRSTTLPPSSERTPMSGSHDAVRSVTKLPPPPPPPSPQSSHHPRLPATNNAQHEPQRYPPPSSPPARHQKTARPSSGQSDTVHHRHRRQHDLSEEGDSAAGSDDEERSERQFSMPAMKIVSGPSTDKGKGRAINTRNEAKKAKERAKREYNEAKGRLEHMEKQDSE